MDECTIDVDANDGEALGQLRGPRQGDFAGRVHRGGRRALRTLVSTLAGTEGVNTLRETDGTCEYVTGNGRYVGQRPARNTRGLGVNMSGNGRVARPMMADGRWWRPGAVSGDTRPMMRPERCLTLRAPCGASGTRY
eukprot:3921937-Prymnesium_polylepis.1